MLTPAALSIITSVYSGTQRAAALSVWGAIASAGIAVGVVLGGMLTTWLSWHWVFLINVPIGALAALAAPSVLPALPPSRERTSLDPLGALSLIAGLGVLVYAISGAAEYGWGSVRTLGLLALAAVLLVAFAALERRVRQPLIPPSVWRVRSLISGSAVMLGTTGILAGAFFLISIYLQDVLGFSPLESGLGFLPFVATTGLGVHATSHAVGRVGTRALILAGLVFTVIGCLLLSGHGSDSSYASAVLPGFLVLGLGMGLAVPAISITAMSDADEETAGLASGVMSTGHEVGAALGTAVFAAIATAAGGASWSFSHAFVAAAVLAAVLAAVTAVTLPAVRPAPGEHVNLH
jgi:MFS family permease